MFVQKSVHKIFVLLISSDWWKETRLTPTWLSPQLFCPAARAWLLWTQGVFCRSEELWEEGPKRAVWCVLFCKRTGWFVHTHTRTHTHSGKHTSKPVTALGFTLVFASYSATVLEAKWCHILFYSSESTKKHQWIDPAHTQSHHYTRWHTPSWTWALWFILSQSHKHHPAAADIFTIATHFF